MIYITVHTQKLNSNFLLYKLLPETALTKLNIKTFLHFTVPKGENRREKRKMYIVVKPIHMRGSLTAVHFSVLTHVNTPSSVKTLKTSNSKYKQRI